MCDYDTLLRMSFTRHDFMTQELYLNVAGTVTDCSIVSKTGISVRERERFGPH